MADNARDQDFNLEAEAAGVDRPDPLMELAQLMSGDAPRTASPQPSAAPVSAEPAAPAATIAPPIDDLEAQLLSELGIGAPTPSIREPAIEEPVAEAPVVEAAPAVEPVAPQPAAAAQRSIEDELAALLDAEPAAPVAKAVEATPTPAVEQEAPPVAVEEPTFEAEPSAEPEQVARADDRGAAQTTSPYDFSDDARADSREQAVKPEDIVDAFDTDLDDYMAVDFDAMDVELEVAPAEALQVAPPPFSVDDYDPIDAANPTMSEAYSEPLIVEDAAPAADPAPEFDRDEPAPVMDMADAADAANKSIDDADFDDQLFEGFGDELNDEFDALFNDDLDALDAVDDDVFSADEAFSAEANEVAQPEPEEPFVAAYVAPVAAVAAGAAALGAARDKGDELLDHIGLVREKPAVSPLEELDAIMNEPTPQKPARPDVQTADIDALDDNIFADFDVPELPHEAEAPTASVVATAGPAFDDLDFDLDIESELNSAEMAPSAVPSNAGFDDDFETDDFEAVMARDMEYASHARATPVVDDDLFGDIDLEEPVEEAPAHEPKKRGFLVAGITIAVALIGAVSVFALTGGNTDTSTGPVIVEADPTPIKVEPEEPGGSDVPNQDRALFNADNSATAANQPELVTTSEEPVDIASAPGAALPSAVANKDDERLLPDPATAETGNEPVTSVNARRVRTLVVRPDGTLVEQPVEAPAVAVPEIVAQAPAAAAQAIEDVAEAATQAVTENTGVTFNPPAAEPVEQPAAASAPAGSTQVPVRTVETSTITPPIIADRPNQQPVNIVNPQPQQNTQVAVAPQPAAPAPAAPAPSDAGSPFAVQIASVPSRDGAQQSAVNLQQRFANILSGRGISIQEAQIDGRGTFYRVRVGAQSRDDANALCEQYKRAGGSCFVTR
ncbi:MAG: SPOR domain-containing protein [Ahrensia sp.]